MFAALLLAAALAQAAGAPSEIQFQNVLVRPGDTLWSISNKYLQDPSNWDQILKHNKLPSTDPTVALPGMTLRVPIKLIKRHLRAAHVIYVLNRVLYRRAETAEWKSCEEKSEVFQGDSVRTMESSRAKVRFLNADLLSLDPNSLAIIKPQNEDFDVRLDKGAVFVGKSKVVTATASITPKTKDTQYSAKVRDDLSTLVEVYRGVAAVKAQGQTVDVPEGMSTEVKPGQAPSVTQKISDLPEFEARAADHNGGVGAGLAINIANREVALGATAADVNAAQDVESIRTEMEQLAVGMPVAGYRIQASRDRDFTTILYDKTLDAEERPNLKSALTPGVYWFRMAAIDLLGFEAAFGSPRLYGVGVSGPKTTGASSLERAVAIAKPRDGETVADGEYRVVGVLKYDDLSVFVNGKPARVDETGNFYSMIRLNAGANVVEVTIKDRTGREAVVRRRIIRSP
jgi:hypothetical protein